MTRSSAGSIGVAAMAALALASPPVAHGSGPRLDGDTQDGAHIATVEAERFDLRAGRGRVQADDAASDGKSLQIDGNHTATRRVELPESRSLVVRARARSCRGSRRLRIEVDGQTVWSKRVRSGRWTEYRAPVDIAAGKRELVIAPTRHGAKRGCDRRLMVDTLKFSPEPARRLLFDGDFAGGISDYRYTNNSNRIEVVDDPVLGERRKVLRFRVSQGDTGVTGNPRAQIETPYDFREGQDRYFGFALYFPRDFPTRLPDKSWVTLGEQAYGPPYDGAGGTSLRVQSGPDGARLRWQRNDTYDNDIPWRGPRVADVRGRWVDIVQRIRLDSDDGEGFVELWMNTGSGWEQQRLNGEKRLHMRTYDRANGGGPNNSRLSLYYRKDIPGPLTIYHGAHRIAPAGEGAFEAVDPNSYGDGRGR